MAKFTAEEAKEIIKKGIYSDIKELDKMTEEEIRDAALSDQDALPITEDQAKEFRPATKRGDGIYAHKKGNKK